MNVARPSRTEIDAEQSTASIPSAGETHRFALSTALAIRSSIGAVVLGVPVYIWMKTGRREHGENVVAPVELHHPFDRHDATRAPVGIPRDPNNVMAAVTARRVAARLANTARVAAEGRARVRGASP